MNQSSLDIWSGGIYFLVQDLVAAGGCDLEGQSFLPVDARVATLKGPKRQPSEVRPFLVRVVRVPERLPTSTFQLVLRQRRRLERSSGN